MEKLELKKDVRNRKMITTEENISVLCGVLQIKINAVNLSSLIKHIFKRMSELLGDPFE